ncbi:MAG: RNB domain-containing ribonuclease [Treponema sp.]|jgi:exoribonuclease-2|nr:RNB domain-containing ribonuclease [Treponema sp.]
MISPGCLAVYKNRPALVAETGEKITITVAGKGGSETLRVREKDIEVIHPGPLKSLAGIEGPLAKAARGIPADVPPDASSDNISDNESDIKSDNESDISPDIRGAWELLEGSGPVPLRELAELAFGEYSPQSAWAAWILVFEGFYFTGTSDAVLPRPAAEVAAAGEKRRSRERETQEREAFLERLRDGRLNFSGDPRAGDGRFLQDVEALAYGKSEKSRTLKDLARPETPQEAHRFLLETGFWDTRTNPHPARFGLVPGEAPSFPIPPSLMDGRKDLSGLPAFAIDSPWSDDPDDAVSLELSGPDFEGARLYVHVADPAAAVVPGSAADIEARNRGATAYLPEKCCRMLSDEALPYFALGLGETSPALTFELVLDREGKPAAVEIFPSIVRVTRLTYEEADDLAGRPSTREGPVLRDLFRLGEINLARRLGAGAVNIELPEIHISVKKDDVPGIVIRPIARRKSAEMVRECMLLAGEGAAAWARERRLAFPYISQEPGDLPSKPLPGLAGSYQLRRCMRPRSVSVRPGLHWGLGLDAYTQVTSPLRRYTDLLAHQQIRSFLAGANTAGILDADETLVRLAAGDAAAQAVSQAERASRAHWLAVYLSDKKGAEWEGVVVEKRGNLLVVLIPDLALETQIPAKRSLEPNDTVRLSPGQVRIPEAEAAFREV